MRVWVWVRARVWVWVWVRVRMEAAKMSMHAHMHACVYTEARPTVDHALQCRWHEPAGVIKVVV